MSFCFRAHTSYGRSFIELQQKEKCAPVMLRRRFLTCRCSVRFLGGTACGVPLAANIGPAIPDVPASVADTYQSVVHDEENGTR